MVSRTNICLPFSFYSRPHQVGGANLSPSDITRIFNKINNTVNKDVDELSVTILRTTVEQLQKKKEHIHQLNQQITELVQMPDKFKGAICEVKELQDNILEKINELQMHIKLKTQELTSISLPENVITGSDLKTENVDTSLRCSSYNTTSVGTTSITSSLTSTHTTALSDLITPV